MSSRMICVWLGVVVMVGVAVSGVCGCDQEFDTLSWRALSGAERFRGNVFYALQSTTLTGMHLGLITGSDVWAIVRESSSFSTSSYSTIFEQRTVGITNGYFDGSATALSVELVAGRYYMIGVYFPSTSTYEIYDGSFSTLTDCGLQFLYSVAGEADSPGNGWTPTSPSFGSGSMYRVEPITSVPSNSCPLSSESGLTCNGFHCVDSTCDCPPMVSTGEVCESSGIASGCYTAGGVFATNAPGDNYDNSESCTMTFGDTGEAHLLHVHAFSTESGFDRVTISDGNGFEGSYEGTANTNFQINLCGSVTIAFTSDGSVVYPGVFISTSTSTSGSCESSGPTSIDEANEGTSTPAPPTTSTSGSVPSSSASSAASSNVLLYIAPGVAVLLITGVITAVRYCRYRRSGATRAVNYNPDEDEVAQKAREERKEKRRKRAEENKVPQGRLSDFMRRNRAELGLSRSEEDDDDEYDYATEETDDDTYYEDDSTATATTEESSQDPSDLPPSYGKATGKHVRNRFLNVG